MGTRGSRRLYVVALITGLLFVIGVAAAQWLATGTGSGYAKAVDTVPLATVDVSGSTVGDLYPGGSGDLTLRIANPNPYPVTVTDVTGAGAITSDRGSCGSDHGVTFTDQTGLSLAVPAAGAATHVLAGTVAMAETSPAGCAGAGFVIPVSLSGVSGEGATVGDGGEVTYSAYYDGPEGTEGVGVCQAGTISSEDEIISPAITPTEEIYDGVDNDCDGQIDEGVEPPCDDGDPNTVDTWDSTTGSCTHTPVEVDADADGWTVSAGDCDDANASVHPGAPEVVGNGIDDDCDGIIDET